MLDAVKRVADQPCGHGYQLDGPYLHKISMPGPCPDLSGCPGPLSHHDFERSAHEVRFNCSLRRLFQSLDNLNSDQAYNYTQGSFSPAKNSLLWMRNQAQ
jgi:hypothetical protein